MIYHNHPNTELSSKHPAARTSRKPYLAHPAWTTVVGACIDVAAPVVLWLCDRFPRLAERWGDVDFEECE